MKKGKAYIIGAGPGDFELLTLKAKRILEAADCIIYDRLISPHILELAKEGAEKIYSGKENTEGGLIQEEINQILVQKCLEGNIVARVKGGDPFVFGRGGEEIIALEEKKIPFEVVPGMTSSIAVPAYAGIPVTHRAIARAFHVFTGHTMESGIWHDFETIAKLEGTLIFLMGIKNLSRIVGDLILYGKNSKTPIAIIEQGATKCQRVTTGALENILKIAEQKKVKPPAVIVVGEVVSLREIFQWFEPNQTLAKRILMTRNAKQISEMSKYILEKGGIPVSLPLIEIESQMMEIQDLQKYSALLFNSANGVHSFFQLLKDIRCLSHIKIGAVGVKTKEALEEYKIVPDFIPVEYLMDKLAEETVIHTQENAFILIVTSDISPCNTDKYKHLYHRNYEKLVTYYTKKRRVPKKELVEKLKDIDIITFLSSSTVEAFYENIEGELSLLEGKQVASIGPITTASLQKLGIFVDFEATKYTAKGIIDSIFKNKNKQNGGFL